MRRAVSAVLAAALVLSAVPSLAFAGMNATPGVPTQAATGRGAYVRDSVIVGFKDPVTTSSTGRFTKAYGVTAQGMGKSADNRQMSVKVPRGQTVDGLIGELKQDPTVAFAEPNYIRQVTAYAVPPSDPAYADSGAWSSGGVTYAYAKSWWLRGNGSNAVGLWPNYNNPNTQNGFPARASGSAFKVGVIDTGFYMDHPDKGANIVAGKDEFQTYTNGVLTKDFDVTPASDSAPRNTLETAAHGTCVAGEIAAATNNGVGVASVGYDLQVRVYKVLGIWTEGDPAGGYPAGSAVILDSAITDAIYSATNDGCKVINMSLGGPGYSSAMQTAINYAYNHGVVVVAATGNSGVSTNFYPAACANVVGVGSYGLDPSAARVRSSFTNYGSQLDVLAPGQMIYGLTKPTYDVDGAGTAYPPGYEYWQGTSMASPAFAGMLAMVWRFAPALTNAEITSYMLTNATPAGSGQPNTDYGYGYVNVAAAYAKLKTDFPYLASASISTTKTAYGPETVNLTWAAVAGRSVQYQMTIDGSVITTQAALTKAYSGLGEGTHTFSVVPTSSYNWSVGTNGATYVFTVDRTAPVVSGISFASDQLTWSDTEGSNTHTTRVRIDSSVTQTVTGNALTIPNGTLAGGSHTAYIAETDAVGNVSPTYSYGFEYVNPPAAPTLSASYTAYSTPFILTWSADPAATYEYVLNGAAVTTAPGGFATLGLNAGTNTLRLRIVKNAVRSGWVDTTITYTPPLPAVVSVNAVADVTVPSASLSWAAVAFASSYDYRLNGGTTFSVTDPSVTLAGLTLGSNTVEVRSRNDSGTSAWAAKSFSYVPPAVLPFYDVVTATSRTSVTYGGPAALVTIDVRDGSGAGIPNEQVVYQYSSDNSTWLDLQMLLTDASGRATYAYQPSIGGWVRAVVLADAGHSSTAGAAVLVLATPHVGTPVAPAKMSHSKYYAVYGYLKARRAAGTYPVRIYKWRYVSGRWKSYGYVNAKASDYYGYSRYARSIRLSLKGKWRVRAYAPADSGHVAAWSSGYDYVTVR
ncbi:MAG TPA: S8 family serine peptidase [Coriobacteriia bacterium]